MIIGKSRTNQPVEGEQELKIFENIVDKDGHPRFFEGTITYPETAGITQTYGKWSLSGTHLLIVLVLEIAENTTLSYKYISVNDLPQWIVDKVIPVASTIVEYKSVSAYGADTSTQIIGTYLMKDNDGKKLHLETGSATLSKDRVLRMSFDLLIDNE